MNFGFIVGYGLAFIIIATVATAARVALYYTLVHFFGEPSLSSINEIIMMATVVVGTMIDGILITWIGEGGLPKKKDNDDLYKQ
ncbi:MAG: hypothetical protein HUK22_05040 [Thermoguttaceae bacterium]|nr:hypothetical protein [Thermoguttaceae bacterium]